MRQRRIRCPVLQCQILKYAILYILGRFTERDLQGSGVSVFRACATSYTWTWADKTPHPIPPKSTRRIRLSRKPKNLRKTLTIFLKDLFSSHVTRQRWFIRLLRVTLLHQFKFPCTHPSTHCVPCPMSDICDALGAYCVSMHVRMLSHL